MKKKLITIALLSIIFVVAIFGSTGSALAEEINFALINYKSENFSEEEIDLRSQIFNINWKMRNCQDW